MIFYILNSDSEIVETIQSPNDTGTGGITATEGIVDEKLDTYELLNLTIPADAEGLENISEGMNIIFEDISGWREYTIYEIEDEDGDNFFTTIRAELSSSELIDEIIEEDLYRVARDPRAVLTSVLEGTRYSVGTVDSSVYTQDFNVHTEYMNVLEVINEYAKNYSAEIRYSYQVQGNKVVGRFVNVYKQYGEYKGKVFDIDRDMTSVTRRINTELLKTTIIPYSTEQPIDPDDTESDEVHRFGIEDIEWSKENGDPTDKPLGQNYLVDLDALEIWGQTNEDGSKRHKKISMEFDLDNPEAIISMAWVQLGRYTKPRVYYEVSAVDLYGLTGDEDLIHEQILLGDTGGVKDHYFAKPIEIQTRAVEITRDLFDPRNNDYVFGNNNEILSVNEGVEATEDMVKDVEELVKTVGDFQTVLDGSTKVYRGSNTPVEPNENDLWFRPHPSKQGHTQMLLFNGSTWEIHADSSDLEDAGRLTFGTLDGAEINVINLIADNISGGQLKLENGIEISNQGVPILRANSAGEVQLNVSKLSLGELDMESELDRLEKGITGITTEYNISESDTEAPEEGWSPSIPTWKNEHYIWTRTVTTYVNDEEIISEPINISLATPITTSTYIAYSNSFDGYADFSLTDSNRYYVGIQMLNSEEPIRHLNDPAKYKWSKIKGEDGQPGIQGPKGDDGQAQHIHIRYSVSETGNPMLAEPDVGTRFIGVAVTDNPETPDVSEFTWSEYVGEDGPQGPQGIPGNDTFTWVKYADTPTSGMSDFPENKKYIGLAFNQSTLEESESYEAYQWSLMPQNIHVGGRNIVKHSNTYYENSNLPTAIYNLTEIIPEDMELTFSVHGELKEGTFDIYASDEETLLASISEEDYQNGRYSKTFRWVSVGGNDRLYLYPSNDPVGVPNVIERVKLEYGNTSTDWSEAPEDVEDKLKDKVDTEVTDNIYEELIRWRAASATREDIGELSTSLTDYLDLLANQELSLEEAKEDITDMLKRIPLIERELGDWADQWNFIDTYIRMAEEGLLIQERNGSTGIRVSTDRIEFLPYDENGNPVAYISNQVMKINRAIFVESMQVGEHKIETISNGHTVWQWMG